MYALYALLVALWTFVDAPQHGRSRWAWSLGTFAFPPLTPQYFARTLPAGKYWKYLGLWLFGFVLFYAVQGVAEGLEQSTGYWVLVAVLALVLLLVLVSTHRRPHMKKPAVKWAAHSKEPSMDEKLKQLQAVVGVVQEYVDVVLAHPEPINDISLLPCPKDTLKRFMQGFILSAPENKEMLQGGYLSLAGFMEIDERDKETINFMNCVMLPKVSGSKTMTQEEWESNPEYARAMDVHQRYMTKRIAEEKVLQAELDASLAS